MHLFILGTGQDGGRCDGEGEEGMLEYQRLTPTDTLAKVLGYLFGLPVREYFPWWSLTMPYTIWAIWSAGVRQAFGSALRGLLRSAILYHMTGSCRYGGEESAVGILVSIAIVFPSTPSFPSLSKFGLVFFEYFAIKPVASTPLGKLNRRAQRWAHVKTARAISTAFPPSRTFSDGPSQIVGAGRPTSDGHVMLLEIARAVLTGAQRRGLRSTCQWCRRNDGLIAKILERRPTQTLRGWDDGVEEGTQWQSRPESHRRFFTTVPATTPVR